MNKLEVTSLRADSSAGRGAVSPEAAPLRFGSRRRSAYLYVDGFNLYYGALKGVPLRWLNPLALSAYLFPAFDIIGCKYFSAKVAVSTGSEEQASNQAVYWRALRTLPSFEIVEGHFKVRRVWARAAEPPPEMVEILRAEEKGSDVNLASHLLVDALVGVSEVSIVISGDSDLVTPIGMLTRRFGRAVGLINPQRLSGPGRRRCRGSSALKEVSTYYRGGVTWAQLQKAQFPEKMRDEQGVITAPSGWTGISSD